jgi:hypothetical protein
MINMMASCFDLVASLLLGVTRATTSALATRREDQGSTISGSQAEAGFTVMGILCELYAFLEFAKWLSRFSEVFNPGTDGKCTQCNKAEGDHHTISHYIVEDDHKYCCDISFHEIYVSEGAKGPFLCLITDIGLQVGKLFPGSKYSRFPRR